MKAIAFLKAARKSPVLKSVSVALTGVAQVFGRGACKAKGLWVLFPVRSHAEVACAMPAWHGVREPLSLVQFSCLAPFWVGAA